MTAERTRIMIKKYPIKRSSGDMKRPKGSTDIITNHDLVGMCDRLDIFMKDCSINWIPYSHNNWLALDHMVNVLATNYDLLTPQMKETYKKAAIMVREWKQCRVDVLEAVSFLLIHCCVTKQ